MPTQAPAAGNSPAAASAAAPTGDGHAGNGHAGDVMFARMLMQDIDQAALVLPLAATRSLDAEVRMLAAAMEATQAEERGELEGLLAAWQEPVDGPLPVGTHAGHGAPATVSAQTIQTLRTGPASGFDRLLLTTLAGLAHSSVEAARLQLADGSAPQARVLAERVVASRTAEIAHIRTVLQG